jgi:hypothetical protein
MKTVVGMAAALLLGCISACGSSTETTPASESAADARASETETFYRASAATRSELGVFTWSAPVADGGGSIKGRDASRAVIVELRRVAEESGDAQLVRYVLKQGDRTFSMTLSLNISDGEVVGFRMLDNTFATSAEARHTLDQLNADLKAEPASSPRSTPSTGTTSQALTPQDLGIDNGPQLTNCSQQNYATCPNGTHSVTPCKDIIQIQNSWSAQTAQTCALCDGANNPTVCNVCSTFTHQSEQQQSAVNRCISENPAQCCATQLTNDNGSGSSSDPCSPPAQCWQTCGCGNGE